MRKNRSSASAIESLESRTHLSASPKEVTHTQVVVSAATLGQAVTIDAIVKDAAKFGSPGGSVALEVKGTTIQTVTLSPITSTNAKFAESEGTYTIPAGAGGPDYYFGRHALHAVFSSTGLQSNSSGNGAIVIKQPKYTRESDGLKIATVGTGTGVGITAGQTATMLYTGYLAANGKIFDDSADHAGQNTVDGSFPFQVEASPEQVIPGFDEGTVGMEVGETRVLFIPSKIGYGKTGSSPIPPNANLVFLITLESIS